MPDIACIFGIFWFYLWKSPAVDFWERRLGSWFPVNTWQKTEDFIYGKDKVVNDENVCLLMKIGEVARRSSRSMGNPWCVT